MGAMRNRYRLVVPIGVAGAIALGSWVPTLSASASPHLPAISAAALVTKVERADVRHFSGSVRWSADLGLPSLSSATDGGGQSVSTTSGFDVTSLLSGTHDFSVATDSPGKLRVSAASTLQESDLVVNGDQAWISESSTGHVRHLVAASGASTHRDPTGEQAAGSAVTPQAVADALIAHLRAAGTEVHTSTPVMVAGHAAYELVLAPDRSTASGAASTVREVAIAVDATTGMVLRVTVDAVGQSAPALQVGFTSLSYATPSASDFAPLTGLSTTTTVVHAPKSEHRSSASPAGSAPSVVGAHWGAVVVIPAAATARELGRNQAEIDSLTTAVSGSWGHGRLLTSSLLNALLLPDGRLLVGFVSPATLEHTAAGLS